VGRGKVGRGKVGSGKVGRGKVVRGKVGERMWETRGPVSLAVLVVIVVIF